MCHQWKNYYQIVDNLWYGWYGLKKELVQEQKLGMHKQVIRAQGKYCCYVKLRSLAILCQMLIGFAKKSSSEPRKIYIWDGMSAIFKPILKTLHIFKVRDFYYKRFFFVRQTLL